MPTRPVEPIRVQASIGRPRPTRRSANGPHRSLGRLGSAVTGHRVAAVAGSVQRLDIGGAVEGAVLHLHQLAGAGELQIGIDGVGAERDRQLVTTQRVLGQIAAGAAMGDDDGSSTATGPSGTGATSGATITIGSNATVKSTCSRSSM